MIRTLLETAEEGVRRTELKLAGMEHSGGNLADIQTIAEETRTYLAEVLPIAHALSIERIKEKTDRVNENADNTFQKVEEFKKELKVSKRNLPVVLDIICANILFLYLKRRSLSH